MAEEAAPAVTEPVAEPFGVEVVIDV
jgi:hypothetical protein